MRKVCVCDTLECTCGYLYEPIQWPTCEYCGVDLAGQGHCCRIEDCVKVVMSGKVVGCLASSRCVGCENPPDRLKIERGDSNELTRSTVI